MSKIADLVEAAFLAGYRHGLQSFASWHDGQRFVSVGVTLADASKDAPDNCREAYRQFLEYQRGNHEETLKC